MSMSRKRLIILFAIVTCMSAIATQRFIKWRVAEERADCIYILQQIDGSKQQWAIENKASSNAIPTWKDIYPYGGRGRSYYDWYVHFPPECPSGGRYTIGRVDEAPNCSIPT